MTSSSAGAAQAPFDEYVVARWARLVRSASLLGLDAHAAEDAVQTTLARCCFRWERISRTTDPDAYVHRVLINVVRAGNRRRWRGERPTEVMPETAMVDPTVRLGESQVLLDALRRLPLGQRQVVVLRFYADLTEAQTAQTLGVPVGTVKSRCARALAALKSNDTLSLPAVADHPSASEEPA